MSIEQVSAPQVESLIESDLIPLLCNVVEDGASIGFLAPLSSADARSYWQGVLAPLRTGEKVMFVASIDGRVVGAVQLALEPRANGRHRAEVQKLMVHTAARNHGLGRRLMEAVEQAARNVNRPAYARAYQEGAGGLWDDALDQISQAPVVQDAIRKATVTGANDAARRGFTPVRNPFVMNRQSGRMELRADARGATAIPSLQFWDTVKRNLDGVGTRDAQDFARVLRDHLDTLVPSYQQARAGAAHFFGARDALEAGQNFVTAKMANADARRALSKMTPTERQLFQDGFVSRFVEMLNEVGDRRSVLNKIANSPAARDKLNIALGRDRSRELETGLRVEGIMDLARNAVQGNSTTARQLAELGLAGGTYGISTGGNVLNPNPTALMNAAIVYGAARGKNAINERLARRVAEMLVSNDPRILLRGIRTVAKNENLFNSLRVVDRGLARIGGEQSSSIPALQATGVGRADDQPDIPRP